MPYINLKLVGKLTKEQKQKIAEQFTETLLKVANKPKEHTYLVIDEVAGYLVSMVAVPVNPWTLAAAFLIFRLFDIVKPWPIGWLDRRVKGGFGIMIDDLFAGLYSLGVMWVIIWLYSANIK